MPTLQIIATQSLAGKTTIAVALAQGLAGIGRVSLVRLGKGEAASQDAETFTAFYFASTPGSPIDAAQASAPGAGETRLIEADAAPAPVWPDAPAILTVRGRPGPDDVALGQALGDRLIGTIAIAVPKLEIEAVARDLTNQGLRPLALLQEDRALAAPSVDEIRSMLNARVLFAGDNETEVVEDVLIAPVSADPARPHFRRFASKAVLAPFNKTDLHLAAIETQAACLVITGGHSPSPYVLDRAQHGNTTVLLTDEETPATLTALGDVWLTSRFRGQRKAAAAFAYLDGRIDFAGLAKKLEP